jgi:hypothetical protein
MYRTFASLILAAVTLAPPASTATGAPAVQSEPSLLQLVQYGGWRAEREYSYRRYCARLRRACMFKEERGEIGEGNCRRYRRECGRY